MKRTVETANGKIEYFLTYKNVKNINLRIKPDGTVNVSAYKNVPISAIEEFLNDKKDFIFNALLKYKTEEITQQTEYFKEDELKRIIVEFSNKVYPYFKNKGVEYPKIKFRKMVSRWGSCHTQKKILTFNLNLKFAPRECVEYVILHEFTHFLVPNHSKKFYDELKKTCPDWKEARNKLKNIHIR